MPTTIRGGLAGYLRTVEPYAAWSHATQMNLDRDSEVVEYVSGTSLQ